MVIKLLQGKCLKMYVLSIENPAECDLVFHNNQNASMCISETQWGEEVNTTDAVRNNNALSFFKHADKQINCDTPNYECF